MPTAQTTAMPLGITMESLGALGRWPLKPLAEPVTLKPLAEPAPKLNAELFPTLAASGFIFPEAISTGSVVELPCACPTCGRTVDRVPVP